MNRTILMIFAVSLMGGTAAFAQPDPQGQGAQEQENCGKPNQPACEATEEEKKKGKGKKPDAQKDQPAGTPGQPPADPATPPAGGPQGKKQGGQADQPAAGGQQGPQGSQGQQGPQGPQTQPPTDPATPPAGGPRGDRRGGQKDQPPAAGTQQDQQQQGTGDRQREGQPGTQQGPSGPQGQFGPPPGGARWNRGQYVPQEYRRDQYFIMDWQRNNFPPPPRGYRWACYGGGDCFLIQLNTGYVLRSYRRDDRYNFWRRRYSRMYTYNDDLYYRECRGRSDPAGILVGGLIGGLIGRSIGDERAGPTFAGIIIGGALGAAFTRDLDCDDRSYAYHSYYDAFNSGRVGRIYSWHNPRTRHRGAFLVRGYYYDEDGFRCARYRHTVWFDNRRRRMDGYACRQPDGAWLFIR